MSTSPLFEKTSGLPAYSLSPLPKNLPPSDKPYSLFSSLTLKVLQIPETLPSSSSSTSQNNQNQNNQGFGWRWNPWMMNGLNSNIQVSQFSEGTLFIDFIDTTKKELIWQGIGSGALKTQNREKKEIRIKEFVAEIMTQFPPESNGK